MPCFKGLAVSIHSNGAPIAEHGMQKQSRVSRISSFIPVPTPQISPDTGKPEPAKFAISITLLTPGCSIPYSTPKATDANPYPQPQHVGELPLMGPDGKMLGQGIVAPYTPMTNSENETVAAYIYFDGRAKEEVATLLRPGEETWVNSRWVQVPDDEGGGLAEREFLFREVGLERWLNGLDLEGDDAAAKVEKRRERFERRKQRQAMHNRMRDEMNLGGTLRYGNAESGSPVEPIDDVLALSDDSDDDDSVPEAAGQIKVAMFRVLASGEIKKGEYSPQFDAHDDDDGEGGGKTGVDADVEHTTSFAKPKTLDPKTISTQTVTGIDGPDKPYATFTFFYRGERQLQKMGVLPSKTQTTPAADKRRSAQLDFSTIGPLKTSGTVGFSTFRDGDSGAARQKKAHRRNGSLANAVPGVSVSAMDEDSDDDDDDAPAPNRAKMLDGDRLDDDGDDGDKAGVAGTSGSAGARLLAPEDAQFSGELADGVNRIRLKRQHSAEPDSLAKAFSQSPTPDGPSGGASRNGSTGDASASVSSTAAALLGTSAASNASNASATSSGVGGGTGTGTGGLFGVSKTFDESIVGSPLKKHRASVAEGTDGDPRTALLSSSALGDILAKAEAAQKQGGHQIGSVLGGTNASTAFTSGGGGSGLGLGLGSGLGLGLGSGPSPLGAPATVKEEDEEEL